MKQKILNIITHPNDLLRLKSEEIDVAFAISKPIFHKFCQDMVTTMFKLDGLGLAAPQVGQNIRLIVINVMEDNQNKALIMINPKITKISIDQKTGEEGCLSVPNTFGLVKRYLEITCEFYNLGGEKRTIEVDDLMARVIQHEIDHLDGILFIDKATKIKHEN